MQALNVICNCSHILLRKLGSNHTHHLGTVICALIRAKSFKLRHDIFRMLTTKTWKLHRNTSASRAMTGSTGRYAYARDAAFVDFLANRARAIAFCGVSFDGL